MWCKECVVGLLFLFLLAGCTDNSQKQPVYRQNNIHKIEFASGPCFGSCPTKYMIMDSSLEYRFYSGGYFSSHKEGYYCGKMTREYWDRLNVLMDRSGYWQVPDSSGLDIMDVSITEMYIHDNRGVKHIWGVNFPRPMLNAMTLIYYADGWIPLAHCDTIDFRCRAQNIILPPKEDSDFWEDE